MFDAENFIFVLLYFLQLFRCNSLWKSALQPKMRKICSKPLFCWFKVVQGHLCW